MSYANATKRHKERVTLSLSREATSYAHQLQSRLKVPSMSALFERVITDLKRKNELAQLNARASAYYDSLSEAQLAEEGWGQLGQAGLAALDDELEVDLSTPEVIASASR